MSQAHKIIREALAAAAVLVALPASALYEDFEAKSLSAWRASSIGGTGTNGVVPNNGSLMAYVKSVGGNRSSLSIDFPYSARRFLSFEMQANSIPYAGFNLHAGAGVTISFLGPLNVSLGSVSFQNATTPDPLPANTYSVDERQHTYSAMLGELASLAGLSQAASIATVNLSFGTWGASSPSRHSSATVWFDSVAVSSQDDAIDCLFAWAERLYPSAIAPSGAQTKFLAPYSYRYYVATDSFVGVSVKDNRVYYLDAGRNLRDLGDHSGWLATANCRTSQ